MSIRPFVSLLLNVNAIGDIPSREGEALDDRRNHLRACIFTKLREDAHRLLRLVREYLAKSLEKNNTALESPVCLSCTCQRGQGLET